MRERIKQQLTELLNTMLESCDEINNSIASGEQPVTLLEDCQNAAIHVGESIEASEGEGTQAVACLEKYCEVLFHISEDATRGDLGVENIANMVKNHVSDLKSLLQATEKEINKFPKTLEVAFFPYKASMWDSLESIWMAASEDPRCHAVVVPIPYVDRNPDGSVKEEHYEINLYPEEVPVIDYRSYPLDEIHPDIAFIHNPYDEKNLVTSVHPNYYSWRLKEHTDCLVYVPYFALPGNLDKNYSDFSAYHHVNYIVTQTPEHRKSFPSDLPDDMFLPFGSPKFDAIIRKCKNPKPIPEAWRAKMEGKRTFFYNTSLRCAINEPDDYLKKMGEVFKAFAGRDDVCLVWRPHPLLEATFDSMQPEYAKVFKGLRELYIKQNIGIYDDTPCMEDTISWCDAYLGDEGSSVVSSFSMAEKPIYVLNNALHNGNAELQMKNTYYYQLYDADGDDRWIVSPQNVLFLSEKNDYSYKYVCSLNEDKGQSGHNLYQRAKEVNGKVFVTPRNAQNVLVYQNGKIRRIVLNQESTECIAFSDALFSDEYLWLIPLGYSALVRISLETEEVVYHKGAREFIVCKDSKGELVRSGITIIADKLLLASPVSNELCWLDMKTMREDFREIPSKEWSGTIGVAYQHCAYSKSESDAIFWLLPREGQRVWRYDVKCDTFTSYDISVDGFKCFSIPDKRPNNEMPFCNVMEIESESVVFSPFHGNSFIELNVNDGCCKKWEPPIGYEMYGNEYKMFWGLGCIVPLRRIEQRKGIVRLARFEDHTLFEWNIASGEVREILLRLDVNYLVKESGFADNSILYSCKEDLFNNLDRILSSKVLGQEYSVQRQNEHNSLTNANTDGTCGYNICRYLVGEMM